MSQAYQRSLCRMIFCLVQREFRMYAVAHLVTILLVLMLLALPGCSIAYELFLEGQVLTGADQSPVEGAKVTIMDLRLEGANCLTDSQGRWKLKEHVSDTYFQEGKDRKRWLKSDKIKVRIETDGKTILVPCPRVALDKSSDCFGYVMTVLDAQPEPLGREPLPAPQPVEAVKPCHIDN